MASLAMHSSTSIAVLLADVDGTVVTKEKVITERAIEAVQTDAGEADSSSPSPAAVRRAACACSWSRSG